MKSVKLAAIAGISTLCCSAMPQAAHADVTWEHTGSVSVSSMPGPLVNFKTYSSWTPMRHRVLLKYSVPALSMMPMLPMSGSGSAAIIQRLDDDTLLGYESQTKSYIKDSRKLVLSKLILNPWKNGAPELSKGDTPELSEAQRARLGAEVRALVSPFLKSYSNTFFRALPNTRNFDGIEGHGYRLTQLINIGGENPKNGKWMRINFEWWQSGYLQGDEVIQGLQETTMAGLRSMGWPSKSMLANEANLVMLYALPEAYLKALKTIAPGNSLTNPNYGGAPLSVNATIHFPEGEGSPFGDIRLKVLLTKRYVSVLPNSVFEVPAHFHYVSLKPYLDKLDEARKQMSIEEIAKEIEKSRPGAGSYLQMVTPNR